MRPALLLALLLLAAPPACAGDEVAWGLPLDRAAGPNALSLARCEGGACAARLTFRNSTLRGPALLRRFQLSDGGLAVAVTIREGEGEAPDEIAVTPPPGFTADPARLPVEEDGTATVLILPLPLS